MKRQRFRSWATLILSLLLLWGCGGSGDATIATIFSSTGSGGVICGANARSNSDCAAATTGATAVADQTIKVNDKSTLGAQAAAVKFRLLAGAQLQLKANSELGLGQKFILAAGQALFDHQNDQGEIEVEAHTVRIQPLDTAFSVSADADGGASVAVVTGTRGVLITTTLGSKIVTTRHMAQGQQIEVDPRGNIMNTQPVTRATRQLWAQYAP